MKVWQALWPASGGDWKKNWSSFPLPVWTTSLSGDNIERLQVVTKLEVTQDINQSRRQEFSYIQPVEETSMMY
jgi:Iap family predicted aminopeptidase